MLQLIHVGNNKLKDYKSFVKFSLDALDKAYPSKVSGTFQSINLNEVQGINQSIIVSELKKQVEDYALDYLTIEEGKDPIVYLSELGDVRIVRQVAGSNGDTPLGFESTSSNTNSAITTIWHLNTLKDGALEFEFQGIQILPSKKEIIIFPSYFTHAHRFNSSTEDKLFLITTFYIGG